MEWAIFIIAMVCRISIKINNKIVSDKNIKTYFKV
jgi:hypothetical protein